MGIDQLFSPCVILSSCLSRTQKAYDQLTALLLTQEHYEKNEAVNVSCLPRDPHLAVFLKSSVCCCGDLIYIRCLAYLGNKGLTSSRDSVIVCMVRQKPALSHLGDDRLVATTSPYPPSCPHSFLFLVFLSGPFCGVREGRDCGDVL